MSSIPIRSIERFGAALAPAFSSESSPSAINGLTGSAVALFLACSDAPFAICEQTDDAALRLYDDIRFFRSFMGYPEGGLILVPEADTPERAGKRGRALMELYDSSPSIVVSSGALGQLVPSREAIKGMMLTLDAGDEVERDAVEMVLTDLGYIRVQMVTAPGQYSLRGYILDIGPATGEDPVRLEFFGDEIEAIRSFNIESQRSVLEMDSITLMAARLPDEGLPLRDVMGERRLYYSSDVKEPICQGATLLSSLPLEAGDEGDILAAPLLSFGGLGVLQAERNDVGALPGVLNGLASERSVMIVASSTGQSERLRDLMREHGVITPIVRLEEAGSYAGSPFITVGKLSSGLNMKGLMVLTDFEIFGGRPAYRPIKRSKVASLLKNIDDLELGDFVVHEDRGIGRFLGLSHQEVEGRGYDMIVLEYAEGARLHLPVQAIDRIRKYHAAEGTGPSLDNLSAKRWQKTRKKVEKRVRELAQKLLKLYAEREVAEGHAFSPDTEAHREFDSFFPYEETPDQIRAVQEIKEGMEGSRPMDRLLCGDVGYGKTEVAMRAAFKAVFDGKQVAVLVPTTLLCEQHIRVFSKRFAAFPVRVEGLSRFRSAKETRQVLEGLKNGEVDIVIATHSLLRRNMEFADLGLLIIDEEHRFGVKQKERIKELSEGMDVLAMSATPIPRSLQMSLSGIRTMSLIETPPEERQAVKSAILVRSDGVIKDAIARELERGGQVFFVHNRIRDIDRLAQKLRRLAPLARIDVAHGQMKESELEAIMMRFLNAETDVLLSTAIVGAGLDIPTANTMIVDMADRMGLADLYQLKGRVGRGSLRGYAWFLIPGEGVITDEARGRLEALRDMSYMGAGFRLAMKDLEIRGAGNLLGPEQSGSIESVGFDLYMDMLESSVAQLKGTVSPKRRVASINLGANAFVPEGYIEDMALRLSLYRSIARAGDMEAVREIELDAADRFGRPPEEFMNLLAVRALGIRAEGLEISDISLRGDHVRFMYYDDAEVVAEDIISAIGHRKIRFIPGGFEVRVKGPVIEFAGRVLDEMHKPRRADEAEAMG